MLDAEWPGGGFKRTDKKAPPGLSGLKIIRNVCNVGRDLFQSLQHLADDRDLHCGKASRVAAGASEAFGQEATVLQLPAQPKTPTEEAAQRRVTYVG
jgi:hypothetical protein